MSALRSGAGLVSVLTPESVAAIVAGMVPEAMVHAANVNSTGSLASDVLGAWGHDLSGFDAILVGPGMTQHPDGIDVLRQVVDKSECTLVLDADALNLLAQNPDLVKGAAGRVILTPHPGEMARLLGADSSAVQENRFSAVYDVAQKFNAVGVLKGAGTLVCEPGGISWVNMTGNPGMACGGMGDALAGLIVGLSAQGRSPFEAAVAGVYIHGMAGDMAVMNGSQVSLTARDLIDAIPMALRELTGRCYLIVRWIFRK
jgi:NAD(P)H-hydrate epimerase